MTDRQALALIAACLSPEPAAADCLPQRLGAGALDWARIIFVSTHHYVAPALFRSLERRGLVNRLPEEVAECLRTLRTLNSQRNRALRRQLEDLTRILNAAGILPLLLKGSNALAPGAEPGAEDRFLGDLDVQVPEALVARAVAALKRNGYGFLPEPFVGSFSGVAHHLPPLLHPGHPGILELHRELGGKKLAHLLPADTIRRQALTLPLRAGNALKPSPFWRLLHNLVHADVSDRHYRRRSLELRQLVDWVQVCSAQAAAVDWPVMQAMLSERGYPVLLPARLLLVRELFGQDPPEGVEIGADARQIAVQTLAGSEDCRRTRRFRTAVWLERLPRRLVALPRKLFEPTWYGYRLQRWRQNRRA